MLFHRINGFWVLTLIIPGTISGSIVARHSFGGEINVQSAFYVLGLAILFFAFMGIMQVKETPKHRQWMLSKISDQASLISDESVVCRDHNIFLCPDQCTIDNAVCPSNHLSHWHILYGVLQLTI